MKSLTHHLFSLARRWFTQQPRSSGFGWLGGFERPDPGGFERPDPFANMPVRRGPRPSPRSGAAAVEEPEDPRGLATAVAARLRR